MRLKDFAKNKEGNSSLDPTAEEPLNLGKLTEINAFQHEERIQEISGQASSEASLEGILKRVLLHFIFYY